MWKWNIVYCQLQYLATLYSKTKEHKVYNYKQYNNYYIIMNSTIIMIREPVDYLSFIATKMGNKTYISIDLIVTHFYF
jgi:hypothetical protein